MPRYSLAFRNGSWVVRGEFGKDSSGRRVRHQKTLFGIAADERDEAERAASEWYEYMRDGLESGSLRTVGELLDRFIGFKQSVTGIRSNTVRTYRLYKGYAGPLLRLRPSEVTVLDLDKLIEDLRDHGGRNGKPLSSKTVYEMKSFLQEAFDTFVKWEIVPRNPVRECMQVKVKKRPMEGLDPTSLKKLNAYIDETLRLEAATIEEIRERNAAFGIWVALVTGMRANEVCALRRRDVGREHGGFFIDVNSTLVLQGGRSQRQDTTKSGRSRKISITKEDAERIRDHENWQENYLANPTSGRPLVTCDGSFVSSNWIGRRFKMVARRIGIPSKYTFHDLRHTHASLLIPVTDIKVVQERLGHAKAETTLNNYGHVLPSKDRQAADSFAEAMREEMEWG